MISDWKYVKFLKQGTSHIKDSINCQDNVNIIEKDDILVAVLSDGLGSRTHSEIASKAIVDFLTKILVTNFEIINNNGNFRRKLIEACQNHIRKTADEAGYNVNDMDCTILFVVIKGNEMKVGQLGDGGICLLSKDSGKLLCKPQKGALANSTMTLFSENSAEKLYIKSFSDSREIESVILSSDGLEIDLYYPNSEAVKQSAEFYPRTLVEQVLEQAEVSISNRIKKYQNYGADDDISIAVLARSNAIVNLPLDPYWECSCGEQNEIERSYCKKCEADFIDVYKDMDFSNIDKVLYFRSINGTQEERKIFEIEEEIIPIKNQLVVEAKPEPELEFVSVSVESKKIKKPERVKPVIQREREEKEMHNEKENKRKDKQGNINIFAYVSFFFLGVLFSYLIFPRNTKIDYVELANFIDQKQSITNSSMFTDLENTINLNDELVSQKLQDIQVLVEQMPLNNDPEPLKIILPLNTNDYREYITELINSYGEEGALIINSYGYIANNDGSYYIGQIFKNMQSGNGILLLQDGSVQVGYFQNGEKNGEFTLIDINGTITKEYFEIP